MKKVAFMFPGQGSQSIGMGREFYEEFKEVKDLYQQANEWLGKDLVSIMFEGPQEILTETENAQPALLLCSIGIQTMLQKENINPVTAVGHSLGEYSALVAANALPIESALPLVSARGRLMEDAYPKGKGSMAAVLGLTKEEIEETVQQIDHDELVAIANLNCPGQIVITGTKAGIDQASILLKEKGAKRVIALNVSGPFHSELMKPASESFSSYINEAPFKDAHIPVYANVTAKPMVKKEEIKNLLIEQLYSPVQFEASIRQIINDGIDAFVEVGNGKVLCGLVRKIDRKMKTFAVENLDSMNEFIAWYKEE